MTDTIIVYEKNLVKFYSGNPKTAQTLGFTLITKGSTPQHHSLARNIIKHAKEKGLVYNEDEMAQNIKIVTLTNPNKNKNEQHRASP